MLNGTRLSALFAYLSSGKRSLVCDMLSSEGQQVLERELQSADILIDDTPVRARGARRGDQVFPAFLQDRDVHGSSFRVTGSQAPDSSLGYAPLPVK
jgi:hypothetical protein